MIVIENSDDVDGSCVERVFENCVWIVENCVEEFLFEGFT